MKRERFRFAGQTVKVKKDIQKFGGADFTIEDYWENVNGGTSWMNSNGNPAAMMYAIRPDHKTSKFRSTMKLCMEKSAR